MKNRLFIKFVLILSIVGHPMFIGSILYLHITKNFDSTLNSLFFVVGFLSVICSWVILAMSLFDKPYWRTIDKLNANKKNIERIRLRYSQYMEELKLIGLEKLGVTDKEIRKRIVEKYGEL